MLARTPGASENTSSSTVWLCRRSRAQRSERSALQATTTMSRRAAESSRLVSTRKLRWAVRQMQSLAGTERRRRTQGGRESARARQRERESARETEREREADSMGRRTHKTHCRRSHKSLELALPCVQLFVFHLRCTKVLPTICTVLFCPAAACNMSTSSARHVRGGASHPP